jgi:3-phenylpropionate/trans-cinnamate dioxygenase ferredoxin component
VTFVSVCDVSDVVDDQPLSVEVGRDLIAIVRHEGQFFAIRDECSHAEVMLSLGQVEGCTLECLAHGSRFDLRTGRPLDLPAVSPVPVSPVRVGDGRLEIDLDNPIRNQE